MGARPARATSHRSLLIAGLPSLVLPVCLTACGLGTERAPDVLELETLPVIGRADGDGPGVFGRIGDVELDDAGNVYVLDRTTRVVQVFDEDGAFLRTVGRRGPGPGELENPVALAWGPDGSLWIVDPGNGRYSVFDRNGDLVAEHARDVEGIAGGWPVTLAGDWLYDVSFEFGPGGPSPVPIELEITDQGLRRVQQVELPPLGRWGPGGIEVERPGQILLVEVPYTPMLLWQIDTNRNLWYANTATYEVRRVSLSDGMEAVFARSGLAPVVTQTEMDAAMEGDPILERDMIPSMKPPIAGFFPGENGGLWVQLPSDPSSGIGSRVDVFNADAALIATVEIDLALEPRPKVRDGVVVGVVRDDLGVDRIARYRIIE